MALCNTHYYLLVSLAGPEASRCSTHGTIAVPLKDQAEKPGSRP